MRRLPPLNALRAFEAAARHGSFTRAAAELCVTQGAISRQVQALESHYGVALFQRQHRRIELTEQGRVLLPALRDAFDRIALVSEQVTETRRDLKVKVLITFALRLLIPRLDTFQALNPDIQIRLTTAGRPVDFATEDFDAGIVYSGKRLRNADEREVRIFRERMAVVCAPALLERGPPLRTPADLPLHRLILNEPSAWDWERWAEKVGAPELDYRNALIFDTDESALQAAEMGQGMCLACTQMVEDDLRRGRLVAPLPTKPIKMGAYFLVCPQANAGRTRFQAFEKWLLAELGDGK